MNEFLNKTLSNFGINIGQKPESYTEIDLKSIDSSVYKDKDDDKGLNIPINISENLKPEIKPEVIMVNKKPMDLFVAKTLEKMPEKTSKNQNTPSFLISYFKNIILLFVCVFFLYTSFLLFKNTNYSIALKQNIETKSVDNSFMRIDIFSKIDIAKNYDNLELKRKIIDILKSKDLKINQVSSLVLESSQSNLSGSDAFFALTQNAPDGLRRISIKDYVVGAIGGQNANENFITFTVGPVSVAYREMIIYESAMYTDFKEFFDIRDLQGVYSFKDASINNHLLRVLSDDSGIVLVYGFTGKNTIIIAPNTETFEKVYERLN